MPSEEDHPLLTKRLGGAVAVLAFCAGIGLAVMTFDLFKTGLLISAVGAVAAVWIYWSDFKSMRLRLVEGDSVATPLPSEMWAVLLAVFIAIGAPTYVFVEKTWPVPQAIRHLTDAQKERLKGALKLKADEHYDFQINTVPSCDECEQFAEELRDFFSSIPGLQASGGPLIFPGNYHRGVQFVTNGRPSLGAKRILTAIQDAGIGATPETEAQMKDGDFVVLIGRL